MRTSTASNLSVRPPAFRYGTRARSPPAKRTRSRAATPLASPLSARLCASAAVAGPPPTRRSRRKGSHRRGQRSPRSQGWIRRKKIGARSRCRCSHPAKCEILNSIVQYVVLLFLSSHTCWSYTSPPAPYAAASTSGLSSSDDHDG